MFKNLKWKKRDSTDFIYIVKRDLHNVDTNTLRKNAIRKGHFDLGYHYIVRKDGSIENARPDYAYAGEWFDDCEHSIAVLLDTETVANASQKSALDTIKSRFPKAVFVMLEVDESEEW